MKFLRIVGSVAAFVLLLHAQGPASESGTLPPEVNEASGLASSRINPGVLWVHNDSGDLPRVFAINRTGSLLGTYLLQGANAVDWEDMAIGPAPNGGSFLYLADIGDNNAVRTSVRVYRVPEPRVDARHDPVSVTLTGVVAFDFVYEDGPRDAESFMVDPLTGDFYVVSKREAEGNRLYRAATPDSGKLNRFLRVGTFSFTGATGADISSDGLQVLIRRYSNGPLAVIGATYWRRPDASVSLVDLLKQPGSIVPLATEVQGEAIAFSADNKGFYTTTERARAESAPLMYYPLPGSR